MKSSNQVLERIKKSILSLRGFLILIIVWWIICRLGFVKEFYLPSPESVWRRFVNDVADGSLSKHLFSSLGRFIQAYVLGSAVGILIGLLMGIFSGIGRFFRPLLTFFNSLSGITWVPLAIAWFGIGDATITFLVINSVFFMVAVTTLSGVSAVPKMYENAMLTMGAGKLQIIFQVMLPGSLPNIMTGLRVGAGFAWRALIAAEMVAGSSGIGFLAFKANYDFQQPLLLACILLVGIVAIILDALLLAPIERYTIHRWGLVTEGQ